MATPVKTIQFRKPEDILEAYMEEGIPCFAIKQDKDINFRYTGDSMDEGREKLKKSLHYLKSNESAAIYKLCIYENVPEEGLTNETPYSMGCNFRFADNTVGWVSEEYKGGYGDLLSQLKAMREELTQLKEGGPPNKLGWIGDVMEMEAVQPIVMGIAQLIADKIYPNKVGEVARISGIPGMEACMNNCELPWLQDEKIMQAITRLHAQVADLGMVLDKLAGIAEKNPKKFASYLKMLQTFG
jgi:hypothetical protein